MEIFDKVGKPITPGCIVAYAVKHHYSPALNIAKVLAVTSEKIKVQTVDHKYDDKEPELMCRVITLGFPDRMVVLQDAGKYAELLDGVR